MRTPVAAFAILCALQSIGAGRQLKMVNVVFRHGDRTPTYSARFPADPYYNSEFYPCGYGALTRSGKARAYRLGQELRAKYADFLGDVYLPELLAARSTDYDRTKMSLQLVLAALYPPSDLQRWHESIDWQPVPTNYAPRQDDDLLGTTHQPKFLSERKRVEEKEDIKRRAENLTQFMAELSGLTGKDINGSFDIKRIYDTLVAESFMNLTLPSWSAGMLPEGKLYDGILLDYDIISYDDSIVRVLVGKLMSKITADISVLKDNTKSRKTKLHLYSGHEVNIVGVLKALNLYEPHVPQYSSAVIMELFEDEQKYYVKVLYYRGIPAEFEELQMPGCSTLCPLEKYLSIVENILEPVIIKST